ncbi:uncharacterized protein LOC115346004 [Aquila chrysaetos chrysaetos]|uniref:uncharacterized protein LOC115346004 n=1 Tax=Aquila chrysaetos chrysaetos TaxID=223781 RepID=UPI0011772C1A|nr:uncharacterized protein LOC115346004 [Aquila chrysaetos chrysaetos]
MYSPVCSGCIHSGCARLGRWSEAFAAPGWMPLEPHLQAARTAVLSEPTYQRGSAKGCTSAPGQRDSPQLLPCCVHLSGLIRVTLRSKGDLLLALLLAQLDHRDLILHAPASVTAARIGSYFPFFFFSFSGIYIKLAFINSLCIWSNDELYQGGMTEKTPHIKTPVTPPRLSFICFVGKQQVFKDFNPQHYNPPNKNKKGVSPGKSNQTGLNPSVRKGLDKYFPIGVHPPPPPASLHAKEASVGLMVIQISPYLKDTTLSFTVRTLIYQLLMATGFMALVPQLRCEQPRLPVAGSKSCPRAQPCPKRDFFGGSKSFRGDLIEKRGIFSRQTLF